MNIEQTIKPMKTIALVTLYWPESATPEEMDALKADIRSAMEDYAVVFRFKSTKTLIPKMYGGQELHETGNSGVDDIRFMHPYDHTEERPPLTAMDISEALRR